MEDLAKYIRSYKAIKEKPAQKSSIPDTESIDTNELLSEVSSEFSVEVRPRKKAAIMSVQKLKQQRADPRKRPKQQKRTPLKVVQEEDECENAHSSYNLTDYLPERDLTPGKSQPKQVRQPVRLKKPKQHRFLPMDPDAQSTISSVDTEALLKSSDEEEEEDEEEDYHYALPRSLPPRQVTPPTQSRASKVSTTPSHYGKSSDILEQIRSRTASYVGDDYPRPPIKEQKPAKPSPTYDHYQRKETEESYARTRGGSVESYSKPASTDSSQGLTAPWSSSLSPHHNKRETADFRYSSHDSSESAKPVSLTYTTQQTSIKPSKRLQLVTVSSMSIVPGNTTRSLASEFSLNDPLQSSRKVKIPSVPDTVRVYSSMASVPMDSVLRLSGADSARSRDSYSSTEDKATPLLICTCILAGELRRHLPTCKKVTISAVLPSDSVASSVASLPFRQQTPGERLQSTLEKPTERPQMYVERPSPVVEKPMPPRARAPLNYGKQKTRVTFLDAVVKIQRAFRRFLRLRRPKRPIREIETWTLEEPLERVAPHAPEPRPLASTSEPNLGDSEADRATRSLFNALDQLRALRDLASNASSRETSFTLSESAISREVTPGQSRIVQAAPMLQEEMSPRMSDAEDFHREGDTSIDTDILLRSSESIDFP